jgi:hypothetical protein
MSNPSKYKIFIAFLFFGIETLGASVLTFMTNTDPKNAFLLGRSAERWLLTIILVVLVAIFIGTAILAYKKENARYKINGVFENRKFQVGLVLALLFVSFLLTFANLSKTIMVRLMPGGVCFWLIGLEILFLASIENNPDPITKAQSSKTKWSWITAGLCILCIYLAALIPSQIPALMDGAPWNTPAEFILLAMLLPLALLVNWRTFTKRWIIIPAVAALAIKLILVLSVPANGINILAFTSQENMQQGHWIRGYESVLDGTVSAVMRQPYNNYREFPLEWVNDQDYVINKTWLGLRLSGYAKLDAGEKLIFAANGVNQGEIDFIDTLTGQKYRTILVNGDQPIDPKLYQSAPETRSFQLQGELVLKGGKTYRLRPVILSPTGTQADPLAQGKLWRSQAGLNITPAQLNFYRFLGLMADGLLIFVILAGFIFGTWGLFVLKSISSLDLYLASSAVLVYLFFNLQPNSNMNIYIERFILSAVVIKALETIVKKNTRNTHHDFWIAIMPILLVSFLSLNILSLRQITFFPHYQDGLEYQTLARDIYVNADYLVLNSPPHAYKVLFPYVVGILHVLFGQSSAGLFFLYAWCAGLTAKFTLEILSLLKLPRIYGEPTVFVLLLLLMGPLFSTYYFSFGLIEPPATACMILVFYFALRRKLWETFLTGVILVLFRLDYIGVAFAGIFLMGNVLQGPFKKVWKSILLFIKNIWRTMLAYCASLIALPVILTIFYYVIKPGYKLSTSDTRYNSISDMLSGLLKILNGGSQVEVHNWLNEIPLDINLLLVVLYLGTLIGLLSLFVRIKPLDRIDARFGIVLAGFYLVYTVASPTGYSPRFSTPLVPLALIIIMYSIHQVFSKNTSLPDPIIP